jgi:hypothetical protein
MTWAASMRGIAKYSITFILVFLMNMTVNADRSSPPDVAAIIHNGIRYEQNLTYDETLEQLGGLLLVIDNETGKLITVIKVYENKRLPDIEGDVQDVFFTSMTLDSGGNLMIINERGNRYLVDTRTRKSKPHIGDNENFRL